MEEYRILMSRQWKDLKELTVCYIEDRCEGVKKKTLMQSSPRWWEGTRMLMVVGIERTLETLQMCLGNKKAKARLDHWVRWRKTETSRVTVRFLYFAWPGSGLNTLRVSTCELFRWCPEGENTHKHDTFGGSWGWGFIWDSSTYKLWRKQNSQRKTLETTNI